MTLPFCEGLGPGAQAVYEGFYAFIYDFDSKAQMYEFSFG